jgi:hypothetical protein
MNINQPTRDAMSPFSVNGASIHPPRGHRTVVRPTLLRGMLCALLVFLTQVYLMPEQPADFTLERLRRMETVQDQILKVLQDIRMELANIHGDMTGIQGAIVRQTERLDLMETRLNRYESDLVQVQRRLEISDS